MPAGDDPSQAYAIACSEDGFSTGAQAGEEGFFRIEHLAPGSWQVEKSDKPPRSSFHFLEFAGNRPISCNCFVEEGKTTHFDIDLRGGTVCILEGSFLLDGAVPAGWAAWLRSQEMENQRRLHSDISHSGDFKVTVPEEGKYSLSLFGPAGGGSRLAVRDEVEIVLGENKWDCHFELGRLEIRGIPRHVQGGPSIEYRWKGSGDLQTSINVEPDAGGIAILPGVPAGRAEIIRKTRIGPGNTSEEVLKTVDVPAGGSVVVDLEEE
jgi:hypothetical protein